MLQDDAPGREEGTRGASWNPTEETRSAWIAMGIGLLVLLLPFSAAFQYGGGPMDEGTLLVYPELIQQGAVPYRDFETFYGPANAYLLAAVYSVFGTTIEVERSVGFLYRVVILVALFVLAKRWGTAIATGCMLIAGLLLLALGVAAYAWLGAMACAISFIWAMAAPAIRWRCSVGGLLAGLAMAFRPDVGPAVILAVGVLLWPLSSGQRLRFGIGAAVGLMPFAILFIVIGMEPMFNNLFLYPVIRSGPFRRLPFSTVEPALVRLFFAQIVFAAAGIVAGVAAIRAHPTEWRNRTLLALALFGAGIMPQAWQRLDEWHLFFVAFFVTAICPLAFLSITSRFHRNRSSIGWPVGVTVALALVVCAIAPRVAQSTRGAFRESLTAEPMRVPFVKRGQRSFPVASFGGIFILNRMLDDLERLSKPGERLFVGPRDLSRADYCDTYIYHLVPKLRPATYFLEMNPMSANRPGSRLPSDIAGADWLILNRQHEPGASGVTPAVDPVLVVQNQFRFVKKYGPFGLLQKVR